MNARRETELLRVLTLARALVNDPTNGNLLALTDAVRLADDPQEPLPLIERQVFSYLIGTGHAAMHKVASALNLPEQSVRTSILRLERRGLVITRRNGYRRICWPAEGAA